MMFAFALLLGFVGFQLGRSKDKGRKPLQLVAGAYEPPQPQQVSYLEVLDRMIGAGREPSLALLQASYREAIEIGNPDMVRVVKRLARMIASCEAGTRPTPQEQVVPDSDDELPEDGDAESWGELANPSQDMQTTSARIPPIDGVPPDCWSNFCEALRTRKPEWSSDNHLGAYEHRKTRLRQLGIDVDGLATEQAQYDALCADIADYNKNCNNIVREYAGTTVDVAGSQVPVTPSGVLGLLKAAGPKGAEGWLRNPQDRTRFPRTTEVFLRCNGNF